MRGEAEDERGPETGRQAGGEETHVASEHPDQARSAGVGSQPPPSSLGHILDRLSARTLGQSRYELRGEVARGGMGAILRAWDPDLRRELAMKVALGGVARDRRSGESSLDDKLLARFLEEAQVTAQLDHPGVVPVHELGLDDRGQVYFTMRLVEGRDLGQVMDEAQAPDATSDPSAPARVLPEGGEEWTQTRLVGVLLKVSEAMAYAHAKGVIHRDLKPANIMVGRFGQVYVMDWGLARVLGEPQAADLADLGEVGEASVSTDRRGQASQESSTAAMTLAGDLIGTPAYMSPEQAAGAHSQVGPAADIYCLGSILYHLLAGHMPYCLPGERRDAVSVWTDLRAGPPVSLQELNPRLPEELVAICRMAMAREISERYASMRDFGDDLRAYLEGRVVRAHRTGPWIETRKWIERNKALAITGAIAVMALLGGLGGAATVQVRANDRLEEQNEELLLSRNQARNATGEADLQRALVKVERDALAEAKRATERALVESRRVAYVGGITAAALNLKAGNLPEVRRQLDGCPADLRGWEWGHYRLSLDTSLLTFGDQPGARMAIYSHDQQRVHAICFDDRIRSFDATSGRELSVIAGGGKSVTSIAVDDAGRRLVSADLDGSLRVWTLETGALEASFEAHPGGVIWVGFQDSGERVLSVGRDDRVVIHDLDSRLPVDSIALQATPQATNRVSGVGLDRAAGLLYVSRLSGLLEILALEPLRALAEGSTGLLVSSLAVDAHSGRYAVGTATGGILVYERAETTPSLSITTTEPLLRRLEFSPDGRRLLACTADSPLLAWDATDGRSLGELGRLGKGIEHFVHSADGSRLLVSARAPERGDGEQGMRGIQVWSHEPVQFSIPFAEHDGAVRRIAFLSDGARLASLAIGADSARLWDAATGNPLGSAFELDRPTSDLVVSANGSRVATASRDGSIYLWQPETGQQLARVDSGGRRLSGIALGPAGRQLALASTDGSLRIHDATTGRLLTVPIGSGDVIRTLAFHPNGRQLVLGDDGGALSVFDLDRGSRTTIEYREWSVRVIALSPHGRYMATCDNTQEVQLWDATRWRVKHHLIGHRDRINDICFDGEGARLFTASDAGEILVWETAGGDRLAQLEGHSSGVTCLATSPDGTRLMSGSTDLFVRDWESRPDVMREMRSSEVNRREAHDLLMALYLEDSASGAVLAAIAQAPDLREDVRACAGLLESNQSVDQRVRTMLEGVWDVVRRPQRSAEESVAALRLFDEAYAAESRGITRKGHAGIVRGLALYRMGRYEEAISTLQVAGQRLRATWPSERLPDRTDMRLIDDLVIAMSHWQLGEEQQAQRELGLAIVPSGQRSEALMAILAEAHALIR